MKYLKESRHSEASPVGAVVVISDGVDFIKRRAGKQSRRLEGLGMGRLWSDSFKRKRSDSNIKQK